MEDAAQLTRDQGTVSDPPYRTQGELVLHTIAHRGLPILVLEHVLVAPESVGTAGLDVDETAARLVFRYQRLPAARDSQPMDTILDAGALSLTHRTFDDRLEVLRHRLQAQTEGCRRLALKGLESAIVPDNVGPMFTEDDKLDGPWLEQTVGQIQQGKGKAW